MALGRRKPKQQPLWLCRDEIVTGQGHPFYQKLNQVLAEEEFDAWLEELCAPYFAGKKGRPSIPPGVYFRMLFIGYLEGYQSERAIAWHCRDRLSLRDFLGYELHKSTPDHSSLSVWRKRLPLEVYQTVFRRILEIVHRSGLVKAAVVGVDSTTIEANASLRRLVHKDSGLRYREYVKKLMQEAGEEPVDEAAVMRFDRKRKGKRLSNEQWRSETDPDARIAKTKKGTTRLAYKPEHVVDLETGVLIAAEVHHADRGDTSTIEDTVEDAEDNLSSLGEETNILAVVADKGYHKSELITTFNRDKGIATYIPEKTSSHRRRWHGDVTARREFHANRQRCRGKAGKRYARQRACLVERSFALFKRCGSLERTTLRGRENVAKRYLIHAAAYNLGILMRSRFGYGTPKGMGGRPGGIFFSVWLLVLAFIALLSAVYRQFSALWAGKIPFAFQRESYAGRGTTC